MAEHPWREVARRAWQAVSAADGETLAQLLAEDAVWHASGRGRHAGDYRGRRAIFDYLAGVGEDADQFDSTLEDILVGDRQTAVLFRVRGRRRGRSLDATFFLVARIEGERIAEIWSVPFDQFAVDEFWA